MAFWVVEKTQFPAFEKYQSQIQNAIKKKQESGADPFETTMDVVTAVAKALGCTLENHER